MIFQTLALLTLGTLTAATPEIDPESSLGRHLMSHARKLELLATIDKKE